MNNEKETAMDSTSKFVAFAAVMTAATALTTIVFQLYIPATGGYFNLGESMVYVSALLFGPIVGCFSGGIGSMLADVLTGFYPYAPATLVVKGAEGFIVGWLSQRVWSKSYKSKNKRSSVLAGLAVGAFCFAMGIYLALMGVGGVVFSILSAEFTVELAIWAVLSFVAASLVAYVIYHSGLQGLILALSMLAGGSIMVTGYFLYEQLVLGVAAIAEVPGNIMQCLIGIAIAFPVSSVARKAMIT